MNYLARLKRLDDAKIFTHTPEIVLPKLTEPGCVSCVSSIPVHIEKIHAANDGEKVVTGSTSPAVDHAGAPAHCPDAVAAELIPDRAQRMATEADANEITALISIVFANETEVDRSEVLAAALADPDGALRCYRAIAEGHGIAIVNTEDDRRTCSQCLNLRGRACAIAKPGGLVSANRGYRPAADNLQRCAGYLPNTTDHNQRPGRKRWPGL